MSEETLGFATALIDCYRGPMPTDLTELIDAYPTGAREKKREAYLSQFASRILAEVAGRLLK